MTNNEEYIIPKEIVASGESNSSESIASEIGFTDTPEMSELRKKILLVGVESPEFSDLYTRFQEAGEAIAEKAVKAGEGFLALNIKSAMIIAELGLIEDALDMLHEAKHQALNQEDDEETADKIEELMASLRKKRDE